ncbi:MAG: hypothetical protein J1F38_08220 [Muribaculaceae bacterium]|nr:hypothetical protein [Muribaculaceae bacterium]
MTIVYVIISDLRDYIVEQALISMHSLRMYNPDVHISAVMDNETHSGLKGSRALIKSYIDNLIISPIPEGLNNTQKSRFLKTSLREIVTGDFLYLDTDTIIVDNISELQDLPFDVAAVANMHRYDWNTENPHPMTIDYLKVVPKERKSELKFTTYFNGGVILAKDTPSAHSFFRKWNELWIKDSKEFGFYKDQISMWQANFLLGNIVKELDHAYNCQMVYPVFALKYFDNAKILHYFSSTKLANHLTFNDPEFLKKIREYGVKEDVERYVKEFKKSYKHFLIRTIENALIDYRIEQTPMCFLGKKISQQFPGLNKPVQSLIKIFISIKKHF